MTLFFYSLSVTFWFILAFWLECRHEQKTAISSIVPDCWLGWKGSCKKTSHRGKKVRRSSVELTRCCGVRSPRNHLSHRFRTCFVCRKMRFIICMIRTLHKETSSMRIYRRCTYSTLAPVGFTDMSHAIGIRNGVDRH